MAAADLVDSLVGTTAAEVMEAGMTVGSGGSAVRLAKDSRGGSWVTAAAAEAAAADCTDAETAAAVLERVAEMVKVVNSAALAADKSRARTTVPVDHDLSK